MKHVFFDLDGTLTDSKQGIIASIEFALSSLDIEIAGNINLETFIGPPIKDTFLALCGDKRLAEEVLGAYRKRFSEVGLYENRLYDGITECLDSLIGNVVSIFIVTSKPSIYSHRIAEHFNIQKYFSAIYGSNLDGSLADKTELMGHVIKTEEIDPLDAVMIGDRKFDIIGAKNNGIRSIGVSWGYGSSRELKEAGADSLCDHPRELYEHIFK